MLLVRIETDLAKARRRRDTVAINTLAAVYAECKARSNALTPKRALTDDEVGRVIARAAKMAKIALSLNTDKVRQEYKLLEQYQPTNLTDEDLEQIAMRQHRIMNVQQIMKFLEERYGGRYDYTHAITIVRAVAT